MRFLKFIPAATLILLADTSAQARIGETEARCVELYGKPVKVMEKGLLFNSKGMRIYITFSGGLADCICVQKFDAKVPGKAQPITEDEIKRFLSDNSHGFQWHYSSVLPDGDVIWITRQSELGALYSQASRSLQVYTRENIVK